MDESELRSIWHRLGRENPWIAEADDPPFTLESIAFCPSLRELAGRVLVGNWCLGTAFAFGELCLINQVNGGDEWLAILGARPFESLNCGAIAAGDPARLEAWLAGCLVPSR